MDDEGAPEADVVDEDAAPRDEDTASDEGDEPPEDCDCALAERHESEEREEDKGRDGDPWRSPPGRLEEDARRHALERERVEHTGTRKQGLVSTTPRGGNNHSVDDVGDGLDAGGLGGEDKGGGGGGSGVFKEARVV